MTRWPVTALHQAVRRDNALQKHRAVARPRRRSAPEEPPRRACRRPRLRRGGAAGTCWSCSSGAGCLEFSGVERLIAACARNDAAAVHAIAQSEPELVREVVADGGRLLAEFAGTANADGVGHLLDLGVDVGRQYDGDGYFDIAKDSTALHVAAWKGWPRRGDAAHRAWRPCERARRPGPFAAGTGGESLRGLVLDASPHAGLGRGPAARGRVQPGVVFPSGYDDVDRLLGGSTT